MNFESLTARHFMRDGLRLSVYDAGGDGLPVLFQHGLCGDARQTAEAFPDDHRFRLITLECRGHGTSDAGDAKYFSIDTFSRDLSALIGELGLEGFALGGISMGAAISLNLAIRHPGAIKGLVFARPAWVADRAPANMRPNVVVGEYLQAHASSTARELFMQSETARHLREEAPDNLASLTGFFDRAPLDVTASLVTSIGNDGPGVTAGEIAGISVPALVIGHERDYIHPLGHAVELAQLIPTARLTQITPKAIDKAAYVRDFHRALTNFLQELL